jgi:hypothetical protein
MNRLNAVEKNGNGAERRGPPYLRRRNPERTDTTAHQSPGGAFSDLVRLPVQAINPKRKEEDVMNAHITGTRRNTLLGATTLAAASALGSSIALSPSAAKAQAAPGKGWFTYLRLYGPEGPAFEGAWKPGDFEEVR